MFNFAVDLEHDVSIWFVYKEIKFNYEIMLWPANARIKNDWNL